MTKDGRSLTCPTCQHIVPLSDRGVTELQSDFHIDHLFEIRDAFNKAEDDSDTNCGSCDHGKATGYCNDCGDFLCDKCQAAHKKMKCLRNHKLISLDELKAQLTSLVPPKKTAPHCLKHSENDTKIYCDTCSTLICTDCTIRLHKDHNYNPVADVLTKHKEELISSLKPVKENLDSVQQALKDFDTRAKAIHDQRTAIETDVHKEIEEQHRLLDQRRAKLVVELEVLAQQKLKGLAAQRDHVEITQAKLASCLEYVEGGLKTGTDGEVLEMKSSVLKRVEQISTEFNPNTIQPETLADMELVTKRKEPLQKSCRYFLEIDRSGLLSSENSHTTGDGLKDATTEDKNPVFFQAMDKKNKTFKGKINLKAALVHIEGKDRLKCEVVEHQHGQHEINYHPMKRGKGLVTGGAKRHRIILRDNLSSENSHTTGDGLKDATTEEEKPVFFQAMDKKNKTFKGKINLKAAPVHIEGKDRLKCEVVEHQHGQHEINYHPMKRGKGLVTGGAKRHRIILRDNIQGITKPDIRRLARRGGVKRISGLIYEETRGVLKVFLENVIRDAVTYTEHAKRKTVTAMDVVYALKRQGRTLYGFGG